MDDQTLAFVDRFVTAINETRDFGVETQEIDGGDTLRLAVSDNVTGTWYMVNVELDTGPVG